MIWLRMLVLGKRDDLKRVAAMTLSVTPHGKMSKLV